jgi:hypothetical protein
MGLLNFKTKISIEDYLEGEKVNSMIGNLSPRYF